ncbi:MAG: DNA translocase FtsK, partial [Desulfobulbaceae bacterium]|nr:DNA translocase FtsK [Desulfobulbaceae bacterium]
KLSRITTLSSDLALRLAARQVRIEAPIPGKSLVGIEVPNKTTATIRLPELLGALEFENRKSNLLLALGKDVSGNYIFGDLKKMPHLLIAGSTGSGKSVCVNTILMSMLYQNSPEDLKLILVDPKRVELTPYNGIPHLLTDVIVENGKVLSALKWAIGEMERRYKMLQKVGSKDISSYNKKAENGEMCKNVDTETGEITEELIEKIPYIVIVIDELADLMASHGKEVEGAVIRLAQMARAIGIHLILSTQKPMVTVITSLIKSNIPTRIAFRVPSLMDSRTILDASGAEKLLGNGDMLFSAAEAVDLRRVQGVFVSEEEVKRVVDFIKKQKFEKIEDDLEDEIVTAESKPEGNRNGEVKTVQSPDRIDFDSIEASDQEDSLYDEAKKIVIQSGKASSSLLQRRLRVGYSRAARLIDMLEERGIIGEADGAKPREILVSRDDQPAYEDAMTDQVARDKWQM